MDPSIVQKYGPGMSFYLAKTKRSLSQKMETQVLLSVRDYSTTLQALHASNDDLQEKMSKLRSNTLRLELDLMKLQRQAKSFRTECLGTWQADVLTRLIEVVYERHRWKMPGRLTPGGYPTGDRDTLSTLYAVAARKIKKETLKRSFGLPVQYYEALQKYDEVSP
ncbi:hypothetical protein EYZ11_008482 [Aspergillus tanneri]|uniref:Uncharacterized protein n=1 Tax=Aspergillus tanneri TaxID=1220188 RepID=A0A4V6RQR5_9EURO|nr:hypothetical protein EYZ11_008482 [Aspergillus tanneri]